MKIEAEYKIELIKPLSLLERFCYPVIPISLLTYSLLQYGIYINHSSTNPHYRICNEGYIPAEWVQNVSFTTSCCLLVNTAYQLVRFIKECMVGRHDRLSLANVHLMVMIINGIAGSSHYMTHYYSMGGTCRDILGVYSHGAQYGEWLVSVPLLSFGAVAVVDKKRLSKKDRSIIVYTIILITCGFLLIVLRFVTEDFINVLLPSRNGKILTATTADPTRTCSTPSFEPLTDTRTGGGNCDAGIDFSSNQFLFYFTEKLAGTEMLRYGLGAMFLLLTFSCFFAFLYQAYLICKSIDAKNNDANATRVYTRDGRVLTAATEATNQKNNHDIDNQYDADGWFRQAQTLCGKELVESIRQEQSRQKGKLLQRLMYLYSAFGLIYALAFFKLLTVDQTMAAWFMGSFMAKLVFCEALHETYTRLSSDVSTLLSWQRRSIEAQSTLLRYIFHEMRIPLNSLTIGLGIFGDESDKTKEMRNEAMESMRQSTESIGIVLDVIMLLHRIQLGELKLDLSSDVAVRHLMNQCVADNSAVANHRGISLSIERGLYMPKYITGDKARLEFAMRNLLNGLIHELHDGAQLSIIMEGGQNKSPNMNKTRSTCTYDSRYDRNNELSRGLVNSSLILTVQLIAQKIVWFLVAAVHRILRLLFSDAWDVPAVASILELSQRENGKSIGSDSSEGTSSDSSESWVKPYLCIQLRSESFKVSHCELTSCLEPFSALLPESNQTLGLACARELIRLHGGDLYCTAHLPATNGTPASSTSDIKMENEEEKGENGNNTSRTRTSDLPHYGVQLDLLLPVGTLLPIDPDSPLDNKEWEAKPTSSRDSFFVAETLNSPVPWLQRASTSSLGLFSVSEDSCEDTGNAAIKSIASDQSNDNADETASRTSNATQLKERRFKILIVDDTPSNAKMLRMLVKSRNHDCDCCENGAEAVYAMYPQATNIPPTTTNGSSQKKKTLYLSEERVSSATVAPVKKESAPYDIVFMDFTMPLMSGPEATAELRALGYKGLIVGITANVLPDDVKHFLSRGADSVIFKPLNTKTLDALMAYVSVNGSSQLPLDAKLKFTNDVFQRTSFPHES